MGTPGDDGPADGLADALLVGCVGDRGAAGVGGGEGGDLDGDGGAGQVVEGAEGGSGEDDGEFGADQGGAELVGEEEALPERGGLGGLPGDDGARGFEVVGGGKVGGDDVDAVAAGGGVEDEAGGGMGVVGDLGALVGKEGDGGIGVAGEDDGDAAGAEEGTETGGEGQREVFFEEMFVEGGSGLGASVGGIEKDDGSGGWRGLLRGLLRVERGRDEEEARQDGEGEASRDVLGGGVKGVRGCVSIVNGGRVGSGLEGWVCWLSTAPPL